MLSEQGKGREGSAAHRGRAPVCSIQRLSVCCWSNWEHEHGERAHGGRDDSLGVDRRGRASLGVHGLSFCCSFGCILQSRVRACMRACMRECMRACMRECFVSVSCSVRVLRSVSPTLPPSLIPRSLSHSLSVFSSLPLPLSHSLATGIGKRLGSQCFHCTGVCLCVHVFYFLCVHVCV